MKALPPPGAAEAAAKAAEEREAEGGGGAAPMIEVPSKKDENVIKDVVKVTENIRAIAGTLRVL